MNFSIYFSIEKMKFFVTSCMSRSRIGCPQLITGFQLSWQNKINGQTLRRFPIIAALRNVYLPLAVPSTSHFTCSYFVSRGLWTIKKKLQNILAFGNIQAYVTLFFTEYTVITTLKNKNWGFIFRDNTHIHNNNASCIERTNKSRCYALIFYCELDWH